MSQELEPGLNSQSKKARLSHNQRVNARESTNLTKHNSKILVIHEDNKGIHYMRERVQDKMSQTPGPYNHNHFLHGGITMEQVLDIFSGL